MQSFTDISSGTTIALSFTPLKDNFKTIMSNSSGTSFPTTNLQIGMECFRTDLDTAYILQSTGPDVWVKKSGPLLRSIENLGANGLIARTSATGAAARTLTAPAAGITVSNGDGASGNPTLALANDLAAIEALASTGIAVRTAADTWAQRTLAVTAAAGIAVTNGNGVSGNPTFGMDINGMTTVAAADDADSLPIYDSSGTAVGKQTRAVFLSGLLKQGKQTIYIPADGMRPRQTSGSATVAYVAGASNQPDISNLAFDPATQEFAEFTIRMPKSWDLGTIDVEFHWTKAGTGTGNAIWGAQAVFVPASAVLAATYGTAQTVTSASDATAYKLYAAALGTPVTVAGTLSNSGLVNFRVYRDAANGSDTFATDALLLGVALKYNVNAADDT